jgi:hypothetical protein
VALRHSLFHAVSGVTHVRVNASPTILSSKVSRGPLGGAAAHSFNFEL